MRLLIVQHEWRVAEWRRIADEMAIMKALSPLRDVPLVKEVDPGGQYEWPSLRRVYQEAHSGNFDFIGYWHLKGTSYPPGHQWFGNMADWRRYMVYHFLQGPDPSTDMTGANFETQPRPHFAGNFWWASAEHIKNLPVPRNFKDRNYAEYWPCENQPKVSCPHTSARDLYHTPILADEYLP